MSIKYKKGYKYQLVENYTVEVNVYPEIPVGRLFIHLVPNGTLTISAGYAWDGPSGPTMDTSNFMRGSLVHDALYQFLRNGDFLPSYRKEIDLELQRMCIEDGMSRIRAWWVYRGVRAGGRRSASSSAKKKTIIAPSE